MVLDALIKIKNEVDSTLTFRRSCREGKDIPARNAARRVRNRPPLPPVWIKHLNESRSKAGVGAHGA